MDTSAIFILQRVIRIRVRNGDSIGLFLAIFICISVMVFSGSRFWFAIIEWKSYMLVDMRTVPGAACSSAAARRLVSAAPTDGRHWPRV